MITTFTNTKDLPAIYAYITVRAVTQDAAAAELKRRYPWLNVTAYWHEPTRTLFVPAEYVRRLEAA